MNGNLLERINLLEATKDKIIRKLLVEKRERELAYKLLYTYKEREIYIQLDTDHCINMICKYELNFNMHDQRVRELSRELKSIQLELILLYDQFNELDYTGLTDSRYNHSCVNYF